MICRNGGSTGSSSVDGSRSRTSANCGAGDPPVADGDLLRLEQRLELGLGPVDLQGGDQGGGQAAGEVHEQPGAVDGCVDPQQPTARRLEREEPLRHLEQHVVAGRLEVRGPRGDHPPRRQRGEDRVGQAHRQIRPAADEERLAALAEVLAGEEVLLHAVVAEVVDAAVDVGDPEHLGLEVQRHGLLDLLGRGGDVERPDASQLHGGRQVDRQALGRRGEPPAARHADVGRPGHRGGRRRDRRAGECRSLERERRCRSRHGRRRQERRRQRRPLLLGTLRAAGNHADGAQQGQQTASPTHHRLLASPGAAGSIVTIIGSRTPCSREEEEPRKTRSSRKRLKEGGPVSRREARRSMNAFVSFVLFVAPPPVFRCPGCVRGRRGGRRRSRSRAGASCAPRRGARRRPSSRPR